MRSKPSSALPRRGDGTSRSLTLVATALILTGCAAGAPELPDPRPVVIRSGARLFPEEERLQEIDAWFRTQQDNITNDPSFMIETVPRDTPAYPWETLVIIPRSGQGIDTAKVGVDVRKSPAAEQAYHAYAHYHLMDRMGRLEEFLPGADTLVGYKLERAIVGRVAEIWLLGRSVYNTIPYDPLEVLMYSAEKGFLDALLLTARSEEFAEEHRLWLEENPEALENYRSWFVDTFSREPPGLGGGG